MLTFYTYSIAALAVLNLGFARFLSKWSPLAGAAVCVFALAYSDIYGEAVYTQLGAIATCLGVSHMVCYMAYLNARRDRKLARARAKK